MDRIAHAEALLVDGGAQSKVTGARLLAGLNGLCLMPPKGGII